MYRKFKYEDMAQALNFGKSMCDNGWKAFTTFLNLKLEQDEKVLAEVNIFL